MKPGDAVEVHAVWASQGRLQPPLKAWFRGYEYVRADGATLIVKRTAEPFSGVEVRYPAADVRPAAA